MMSPDAETMAFEPKLGLVVRYDFLWKEEQERRHGRSLARVSRDR